MKLTSLCVVGLVSMVAGAHLAAADVLSFGAVKDNTLYEDTSGSLSNGAGAHFFAGRAADGEIRRGLIAFDIAGNIPAGSVITNVDLTLHMSKTRAGNVTVELHRVLTDWGEGTSDAFGNEGGGAPAAPGDATWLHTFHDSYYWPTAGGAFSPVVSAAKVVGPVDFYVWASTPELVADAQMWLDNPASNYGWLLLGDESATQTAKRFDTRENTDFIHNPLLTVVYEPPPLIGDMNCDGAVNGFDIDLFVLVLGSSPPYDEYYSQYPDCDHMNADCNDDGAVDGFDIDPFVALIGG